MIAFFGLAQGFLRNEDIVEDWSDDVQECRLESSGEHLGQDFVDAAEKCYRPPIVEPGAITNLWYEGDYPFIDECRGGALAEHCCECLQEVRLDLLLAFMEKFHGNTIVARRFAFRQGANGAAHLL